MKLPPDEIRVLGKPWHLICNDHQCAAEGVYGLTDTRECRILYTTETTRSQMVDTVLHEVFHAIDETVAAGLKERQVHAMAAGFYAVLQDNPDFLNWLARGDG